MGEWDLAPIPDPGSFPSLKDANAKPAPKAPVAKVSVVTDPNEGYTEVKGPKKNKGKGRAKYIDLNRIDNIENAWKGGPPTIPKSVPNVNKNTIAKAISANTSKGASNTHVGEVVKLIICPKGVKATALSEANIPKSG